MDEDFVSDDLLEFIQCCSQTFCLWCGEAVSQNHYGRPKTFCSNKCRWDFHHNKHKAKIGVKVSNDQDARTENAAGIGTETG